MSQGKPANRDAVRAAASEIREYALGALAETDHHDVSRIAGLVQDDDVRHLLMFAERAYNKRRGPDDPDFWKTEWASRRLERAATDMTQTALRAGNLSQLEYLTGMPEYESDVSGLHATSQLINWLVHSEQCKLIYMAALMGRGKTDFSVTFLQVIHWHYKRMQESLSLLDIGAKPSEVPEPEFAANFTVKSTDSGVEVREINDFDTLEKWAEEGSSELVRWYIFDEASTELTAQSGSNAQDVAEVMAPFIKKMRKDGINMIVIGHDKRDVHPAIRSMADFVDKSGMKTASVYSGIKKREPVGHKFDLSGIPETGWDFDTDDMADWDWGTALEDGGLSDEQSEIEDVTDTSEYREWRKQRIEALNDGDNGLNQSDIGNMFDISGRQVRRILD